MSVPGPFDAGGPFGDMLRNLAQLFTSSGPVNWELARQVAGYAATGGQSEANPDPVARVRIEELLRVAELQVGAATGLAASSTSVLSVRCTTRHDWALRTLDAWKPLLEALSTSMAGPPPAADPAPDPMGQLLGNLPQVLGPLLFGMQSGTMVGELASRAMGQYDLPMPRPAADELLVVPATIDAFAADWSLPVDDVRLWVCLREVCLHSVLGRPHVRARLDELIRAYVEAFSPDPTVLEDLVGSLDLNDMSSLERVFGDPVALVGQLRSPEQDRRLVPLRSLLSALTGYVDHVVEAVGRPLIGSYAPLTEALHRRRLEEHGGARLLGRLFGVELDGDDYARGQRFVAGVLERAGDAGLAQLWRSVRDLPTPAELDAPGLWLARIELPDA